MRLPGRPKGIGYGRRTQHGALSFHGMLVLAAGGGGRGGTSGADPQTTIAATDMAQELKGYTDGSGTQYDWGAFSAGKALSPLHVVVTSTSFQSVVTLMVGKSPQPLSSPVQSLRYSDCPSVPHTL